ncbi:3-hydroxyisobutyrate dehydrogenase [Pseudomaricurvus alcaniphilus]|uniref:3-hydroxyisobutyrate dehydrogenase n=1 Tax=Pseudomaricurvus alcaniphilus TaxID=1166482 RepID=UPI00140E2CF2|nr:3-hydroxyisobutyrate dehydrogenase [Pseudomaricurvus alcaniphilus]NHN39519.1 3-hydroxyisobutyrate dehydrogenase [Pseudomaricurvus alcaniphilus]
MSQQVAFIGLGNMGGPMAANLAKAGFTVKAFDLSAEALEKAAQAGCQTFTDPCEAATDVDYVVTMLPSGPIVEAVYIHQQKLLDAVGKHTLLIDCSTVAAENSRKVGVEAEKRGLHFIDAPVSGGTGAAAAGTLAFMCGGEPEDVERAKTVLNAMGSNVFYAGGHGAGSIAKLCNNMLLAVHMIGTAEALQMGVNNGLDPKVLSEIMLKSSGCNWSLEKYNPYPGVMPNVPASKGYEGGFMINLMLKDLGLAMDAAKGSNSAVPMGALAQSLYTVLKHQDERQGMTDFSSVLKLLQ